jgi:peptide/nickel transport system substrate-binding protein
MEEHWMRTWRWVSLLAILALALAACGQQGASPSEDESEEPTPTGSDGAEPTDGTGGEPTPGGTLVFAGARLASSLDPALTSDGESFRVLQQVYEPLVDLAPGSTNELVGVLAESWTGEPGDTEYVFTLREGVTFHDGTPLNAEAVKANFDRMQNFPEELQASAYYYGALMDGFGEDNLIENVEATDELTVTITLREPSPTFLFGITLTPFAIVSPAILESTNASSPEGTFGTDVVQAGTGPFILEDYVPEESATLARNDEYWDEPAYLDRLIIRPIADPAARLQALQGGSIQGFDLVNPSDYETVESEGLSLVERASFNALYLGLNPSARENAAAAESGVAGEYGESGDSPLQDLAVRQAIAMAIDKAALIEAFYGGRGSEGDMFIPPSSGWYDAVIAGVEPMEFDPEGARALLEEAGFGEDSPAEIHFWYPTEVTRPYMPDPRGLHEAVTQQLEDVGFTVVPHSDIWDDPGYLFDAQNGYYDLHFLGWTGDYDDPSNWYGVHFGYQQGEPAAQFGCDVEGLDEAITAASAELDEAARGEAWAEVAGLIHENVCFVTLVHGDTALAFTDTVQGYEPNPTGSESFKSVWLTEGGE